jgi:hypothetical protein
VRQSDGTVPLPPSKVRVGYRRKTRKAGAEDESSCVRVCTAPCTLRSGHKKKDAPCRKGTDQHVRIRSKIYLRATVQNVYAVYNMRVISQNSRRKVIAEGQAADYRGYCMYMIKQLELPPHPVSQVGWSLWLKNLPHTYCIYALVRLAATLLLLKYKYGCSFLLAYIEKMAACNFLSSMKILIHRAKFQSIKNQRWFFLIFSLIV